MYTLLFLQTFTVIVQTVTIIVLLYRLRGAVGRAADEARAAAADAATRERGDLFRLRERLDEVRRDADAMDAECGRLVTANAELHEENESLGQRIDEMLRDGEAAAAALDDTQRDNERLHWELKYDGFRLKQERLRASRAENAAEKAEADRENAVRRARAVLSGLRGVHAARAASAEEKRSDDYRRRLCDFLEEHFGPAFGSAESAFREEVWDRLPHDATTYASEDGDPAASVEDDVRYIFCGTGDGDRCDACPGGGNCPAFPAASSVPPAPPASSGCDDCDDTCDCDDDVENDDDGDCGDCDGDCDGDDVETAGCGDEGCDGEGCGDVAEEKAAADSLIDTFFRRLFGPGAMPGVVVPAATPAATPPAAATSGIGVRDLFDRLRPHGVPIVLFRRGTPCPEGTADCPGRVDCKAAACPKASGASCPKASDAAAGSTERPEPSSARAFAGFLDAFLAGLPHGRTRR